MYGKGCSFTGYLRLQVHDKEDTRVAGLEEGLPGLLPGLSLALMLTLPWLSLLVRMGRF